MAPAWTVTPTDPSMSQTSWRLRTPIWLANQAQGAPRSETERGLPMSQHPNARLTPRGRERMVARIEGGERVADMARRVAGAILVAGAQGDLEDRSGRPALESYRPPPSKPRGARASRVRGAPPSVPASSSSVGDSLARGPRPAVPMASP